MSDDTETEGVTCDEEQASFEAWVGSTHPSGDSESVHHQWENSHEFRDLFKLHTVKLNPSKPRP